MLTARDDRLRPAVPTILLLALLVAPSLALAQGPAAQLASPADPVEQAPSAGSPVHLEVLAGTLAPLDLSLGARAVFFDRLLVGGALGVGVYGELYRGLAGAFGASEAGGLAATLTNGMLTANLYAGVRPFGDGFEILAGYQLLYRSTDVSGAQIASAFGLQAAPSSAHVEIALHALHVELAYTITLFEGLLLRPAIGWTQVLGADPSLRVPGAPASIVAQARTELAQVATQYGMTPTLSLSLGYRF